MMLWDMYKKGFYAWEGATAKLLEQWLKSPLVLGPSGALLTATMKAKAQTDRVVATWWGAWGLPTKKDQERILHSLNQLQSKLIDLEEKLDSSAHRAERG